MEDALPADDEDDEYNLMSSSGRVKKAKGKTKA